MGKTCELMVHPRYEMIDGRYVVRDDNLYDFKTPIAVLEELVQRMREMSVELISFGDMCKGSDKHINRGL